MDYIIGYAIVSCIMCGFFCGFLAQQKNRNEGTWFLWGVAFNIIALVTIGLSDKLEKKR
jgi:hypothetical protein